jgi:hypothetical protein
VFGSAAVIVAGNGIFGFGISHVWLLLEGEGQQSVSLGSELGTAGRGIFFLKDGKHERLGDG